jgi:hypothetical protein
MGIKLKTRKITKKGAIERYNGRYLRKLLLRGRACAV